MSIFGIVTVGMDVYTLGRYAWEDTVFSYEVFRCFGDHIWSGGVSGSKALCGFKELYGLVLRADDVRHRGGSANRRFQTDCAKINLRGQNKKYCQGLLHSADKKSIIS